MTVETAAAARAAGVEVEASSRPGTADAGLDLSRTLNRPRRGTGA